MAVPLKKYQKDVIDDFIDYCKLYRKNEGGIDPPRTAFAEYWSNRGVNKHDKKWEDYHGNSSFPRVCAKVPTGGGKTLIALASIKKFFEIFHRDHKFVVWLVPNDPIKEQIYSSLLDPNHPYRQQLNADFSGNVDIYSAEEILKQERLSLSSLSTHLTILVLNYQSIRIENLSDRRLFKHHSSMDDFGADLTPYIPSTFDPHSIMAAIYSISPFVVLDEGHNAISDLSIEMLQNLNPACVLELTATPVERASNVISIVDAKTLKAENMVKLPLFLWGRVNVADVIDKSIRMRNVLEDMAKDEEKLSGRYIRPIVLFQAPPKLQTSNLNYEELIDLLTQPAPSGFGLKRDQVAIRVGDGKGLHTPDGIKYETRDLLTRECPIRFIVTVNALKEGWDCSFAYILASLADSSSEIKVEQIIGRILRQPYAERCESHPQLNESFVITCSDNFYNTVTKVSDMLKDEGFSDDDYRVHKDLAPYDWSKFEKSSDNGESTPSSDRQPEVSIPDSNSQDPFAALRPSSISSSTGVDGDHGSVSGGDESSHSDDIVSQYLAKAGSGETDSKSGGGATSRKSADLYSEVREEFRGDIESLIVPEFNIASKQQRLDGSHRVKLDKDDLFDPDSFNLAMMPIDIPFGDLSTDIGKMELHGNNKQLSFKVLEKSEQKAFNNAFGYSTSRNSSEFKECVSRLMEHLDVRCIDQEQLQDYVERIVKTQNIETLTAIYNNPTVAADRIMDFIDDLRHEHYKERFYSLVDSDSIHCDTESGGYKFPKRMKILSPDTEISKSLYEIEESVNNLEIVVRSQILASSNVRWFHRIKERKPGEFFINGFRNHYPDFAVYTNNGYLVFVEAKGGHLDGTDSGEKVDMSTIWDMKAGNKFKYVMVFDTGRNRIQNKIVVGYLTNYLDTMGKDI